jgi:hypothetical protein
MLYQLEKWYFDFLTPGGDYFFGYFAQVAFLGTHTSELALHLRRAGPKEPVVWSGRTPAAVTNRGADTRTVALASGRIVVSPAASSITIDLPEAALKLEYDARPMADPGLSIATRRHGAVLWRPVMLGALVEGYVRLRGEAITVLGIPGYVDFLRSTVLPPLVPVRTLCWGRAHDERCDVTYTHATGVRGAWSRLVARVGESVLVSTDVAVEPADWGPSPRLGIRCPERYRLLATGPELRVELEVIHDRAAVESEFISRSPLLRRITRNPRGVKFTGRAVIKAEHSGRVFNAELPLVDEYAIFD